MLQIFAIRIPLARGRVNRFSTERACAWAGQNHLRWDVRSGATGDGIGCKMRWLRLFLPRNASSGGEAEGDLDSGSGVDKLDLPC